MTMMKMKIKMKEKRERRDFAKIIMSRRRSGGSCTLINERKSGMQRLLCSEILPISLSIYFRDLTGPLNIHRVNVMQSYIASVVCFSALCHFCGWNIFTTHRRLSHFVRAESGTVGSSSSLQHVVSLSDVKRALVLIKRNMSPVVIHNQSMFGLASVCLLELSRRKAFDISYSLRSMASSGEFVI